MTRTRRRLAFVSTSALLLALPLIPSPAAAHSLPRVPTCGSEPATIVSDESLILGTPGDDVIVATGATPTTIRGGGGDDIICGTPASDRIFGGLGDDESRPADGPGNQVCLVPREWSAGGVAGKHAHRRNADAVPEGLAAEGEGSE